MSEGQGRTLPGSMRPLLMLLAFTTGLVDAISVLGLDRVFTANMTGNVVLLGFALARVPGFHPGPYLVALGSFCIGAVTAGRLALFRSDRPIRGWLVAAGVFECALLGLAALALVHVGGSEASDPQQAILATALISGAMGFRNASVRRLGMPDMTTTALTQAIAALAGESRLAGGQNVRWRREGGAVAAILLGAWAGAIVVPRTGCAPPLLAAALLVLAGSVLAAAHLRTAQAR